MRALRALERFRARTLIPPSAIAGRNAGAFQNKGFFMLSGRVVHWAAAGFTRSWKIPENPIWGSAPARTPPKAPAIPTFP